MRILILKIGTLINQRPVTTRVTQQLSCRNDFFQGIGGIRSLNTQFSVKQTLSNEHQVWRNDHLAWLGGDQQTALISPCSDLKVKEAGAYSIPVIASDFGPYKDHPSSGVYHARTTREWKDQLYRAMEGRLDGRPNAEYCSEHGSLHNVNLDRVEIFSEVLITR